MIEKKYKELQDSYNELVEEYNEQTNINETELAERAKMIEVEQENYQRLLKEKNQINDKADDLLVY